MHERVIDLFAFFDPNVGGEFRHDFGWVEHVITEYLTDERHDERVLRGFLCFDALFEVAYLCCDLVKALFKFHCSPFLSGFNGIFDFDAVGPLIDVDIFVRCLKIAYNFWVFAEFIRIGDDLRQRCSQRRRNALQLLIIGNGVQFEDPS